jgi:hypothetical protein
MYTKTQNFTKYHDECHFLFGITQCHIYVLYISYFPAEQMSNWLYGYQLEIDNFTW